MKIELRNMWENSEDSHVETTNSMWDFHKGY